MGPTRDYEAALRAELMAATGRSRLRPHRSRLAVAAVGMAAVVVMAVLVTAVDEPAPAAADVEVRREGGRVVVTLTDRENTPEEIEAAIDKAGLDIRVQGQPAGPSRVGRFTGYVESAGAVDEKFVEGDRTTFAAFSLPMDWTGRLLLFLGRPAGPDEAYESPSNAYAAGEPLACTKTLGQPLDGLASRVEDFTVRIHPYDADLQPLPEVSLSEALDQGLGSETVTRVLAMSSSELLVDLSGPTTADPPAMLTLEAQRPPMAPTLRLRIEVASVVVRLALSYVSRESGWTICDETHETCGCIRVTDRVGRSDRRVDVLVTQDSPRHCQEALDAVLQGAARAVVLWDEPGSLTATVDALQQGSSVIPERVIQLAQDAPHLNERQRQTLQLVSAGRSNADISAALCQSPSTTKRDLAELLELFDAANRAGLSAAASRLGYV